MRFPGAVRHDRPRNGRTSHDHVHLPAREQGAPSSRTGPRGRAARGSRTAARRESGRPVLGVHRPALRPAAAEADTSPALRSGASIKGDGPSAATGTTRTALVRSHAVFFFVLRDVACAQWWWLLCRRRIVGFATGVAPAPPQPSRGPSTDVFLSTLVFFDVISHCRPSRHAVDQVGRF